MNTTVRIVTRALLALALGVGWSALADGEPILIDFGPNDLTNGHNTSSPDSQSQYWNNLNNALTGSLSGLVTTNNTATSVGLQITSRFSGANGILNGGLLYPSSALLGNFAITNATEDYFYLASGDAFTPQFKLTGLNAGSQYRLRFFGTRETPISRITRYTVTGGNGSFINDLTTSGSAIGDGGYNGNNSTNATISGVRPNGSNEIQVDVSVVTGGFAYLGILEVTDLNRAPTTTNLTLTRVSGLPVNVRKSDLATDPDGDPLTFTVGTTTNGAALTQDSTFIYVPANTVDDQFTFTVNDGAGGTNSGTVTLPVGMVTPTIVTPPTASDITYGQSLASSSLTGGAASNETAGVSVPGTFAFTTPSIAPDAGSTNAGVTFTPADTVNYKSATVTVTVAVIGQIPTITVAPSADAISFGQTLADSILSGGAATNTSSGVPVPGGFAFTTPSIALEAGITNVSVTFTASDPGYQPVSTTVPVLVNKTTPGLTAPSASGITVGQSLASSILSGGAATNAFLNLSVSGSFAFTTASLVPGLGTTNVSVTFTPGDVANYTTNTITVSVPVSAPTGTNGTITVYGSSVAEGWQSQPTTLTNGSRLNGYAGLMTTLLEGQNWSVTNVSVPGYNTTAALGNFDSLVMPTDPDVVLIGLSLGNEGLAGADNPAAVFESFRSGMTNLIGRCRANGYSPIVALCYPHGNYTATEYQYLKDMNLLMNTWSVPSLNFLGAIDDGAGHWAAGYWSDALHPNNVGHQEMFYSFVPSLLDALSAGKTNSPTLAGTTQFARLTPEVGVNAPLTFTPSNTIHSFTTSFRVRTDYTGTVAALRFGADYATFEVRSNALAYVTKTGAEISAAVNADNGQWYEVALAHQYARQQTLFFINGAQVGALTEQLAPDQFILGGPGAAAGRPGTPAQADLQDWCVYRAGWNPDEAAAQYGGNLQQASLEVCAALDDVSFMAGSPATNRAQSLSLAFVNTTNLTAISPANRMTAVIANPDGSRTLTFTGQSSLSYRVQTATNLATPVWADLATNTVGVTGQSSLNDTNTVGHTQKFYRTVHP